MFDGGMKLQSKGLFVTGTDTGVGKTVATCAIAWQLRKRGLRVNVCKPFATGCRRDREGLVSEDAEAVAHFADCRQPLHVVNPIRYAQPLAPAVAAEVEKKPVDWAGLTRAIQVLDQTGDALVVEGVGGLLVPIDNGKGNDTFIVTVLDLACAIGYPVAVVARATLGTLNHTAMTVRLIQQAGLCVAGVIVNGYEGDIARASDASMATNREWITRMTGVPILATVPRCDPQNVQPQHGLLPGEVLDAVGMTYWPGVLGGSEPLVKGA
ncbi:MAG: dethiobiotin synthase [Phycisphaera sp.]|nr:dethiobiotin synthase [Phycisphaera sp.]